MRPAAPSSDRSMRAASSRTDERKFSTSRVRATIRPARRRTIANPIARIRNAASGSRMASSVTCLVPEAAGSARPFAQLREDRLADLDEIADHDHIREVSDRRVRIAVDRDDRGGGLHADLVLDGAADAHREVELGLHDLARLADLLAVRDPARIDRGSRRSHRATEGFGEVCDEPETFRPTDATAAGNDDPRVIDGGGG